MASSHSRTQLTWIHLTEPTHPHGVMNGLDAYCSSSSRHILQILESDNKSFSYTTAPRPPVTALGFIPRSFVKLIGGKFSGAYRTVGLPLLTSWAWVKLLLLISI